MSFSIIAAISSNNVIGRGNKLPWNIPEDLQHFYNIIRYKTVVMGRKTYESIGGAIKDSQNIVLSRDSSVRFPSCKVIGSVSEVLDFYKNSNEEVMVIGGADIYKQFLPYADKMYLTFIHGDIDGDVYFPKWSMADWEIVEKRDSKNKFYSYSFVTLKRKAG